MNFWKKEEKERLKSNAFDIIIEPRDEKTCFFPHENNKGANQPVHLRSLISAFAIWN